MNQPDLGILIADLRKKQGLTQEELVELCNINVRTIQRIEAGEVNPRSYTIKNILEALGTSIDDVFKEDKGGSENMDHEKADDHLSINQAEGIYLSAAVAGIIHLFLSTLITVFSIADSMEAEKVVSSLVYTIFSISDFLVLGWFYFSLYTYGVQYLSKLFAYSCLIFIIANLFIGIWDVIGYASSSPNDSWEALIIAVPATFLYGLCYLFMGIGLFIERKRAGDMVKWTGILGIIGGFGFMTVLLFPIGIIGTLSFEILLVVMLFNLLNKKASIN